MYYYFDASTIDGQIKRHIFTYLNDGGVFSFPMEDHNPNMIEYEAWIAEGNEPEEWSSE